MKSSVHDSSSRALAELPLDVPKHNCRLVTLGKQRIDLPASQSTKIVPIHNVKKEEKEHETELNSKSNSKVQTKLRIKKCN